MLWPKAILIDQRRTGADRLIGLNCQITQRLVNQQNVPTLQLSVIHPPLTGHFGYFKANRQIEQAAGKQNCNILSDFKKIW